MQLYINEWPEIEKLVNNEDDSNTIKFNLDKLIIFIIDKVCKYNMIEVQGTNIFEKIEYSNSENIIPIEILKLFKESQDIICNGNSNEKERLISLRNEILEWFFNEYKNHEKISTIYGNKVFKSYNNIKKNKTYNLKRYKKKNKIRKKSQNYYFNKGKRTNYKNFKHNKKNNNLVTRNNLTNIREINDFNLIDKNKNLINSKQMNENITNNTIKFKNKNIIKYIYGKIVNLKIKKEEK